MIYIVPRKFNFIIYLFIYFYYFLKLVLIVKWTDPAKFDLKV